MAGSSRRHEEAAVRHEHAAKTHEQAAAFWEEHRDDARAELHRDAAAHEHAGAALERRWADLIASDVEVDERARDDGSAASRSVQAQDREVETLEDRA